MSFFSWLGKVVSDAKGFAEEQEAKSLERKRKTLARLKESNLKSSEKKALDEAIALERSKLNKEKSLDWSLGGERK